MNPDLIDGLQDPRDTWARNNVQARPAGRGHRPAPRPQPDRLPPRSGNLGSMHDEQLLSQLRPDSGTLRLVRALGHRRASSRYSPANTARRSPGTGPCTAAGTRASGPSAAPGCPGSSAWPSGTPSSSATAPSGSARWRRRTCAGRPGSSARASSGTAGTTRTSSARQRFDDRHAVIGLYLTDNWRAFRTWGVSATSPWEHGHFWRLRDGVDRRRKELPVDWDHLQRPGFSPDLHRPDATNAWTWPSSARTGIATADGQALHPQQPAAAGLHRRQAQPLHQQGPQLPPGRDRREAAHRPQQLPRDRDLRLRLVARPLRADRRDSQVTVPTGQQERIPLNSRCRPRWLPGKYELHGDGQVRHGRDPGRPFAIHVLPRPPDSGTHLRRRIALFDPKGETAALLKPIGVSLPAGRRDADLSAYDMLIIGKAALTVDGPAPRIERVRDGLKVIVFEQTLAGAGEAARIPRRGVRPAAGLPRVVRPSRSGRDRPGTPARLARRGDAPAAAARLRVAAASRPHGAMVRHPRHARLAVRQSRQRGLGPDREAGSRRLSCRSSTAASASSTARSWSTAKARAWCSSASST